jgi:ABC-2 type transport system permease protein
MTLRYPRLFAHFVRFSFVRALQFRLDFFFRVFMDALWYGHYLLFFGVLHEHVEALGGWTRDETRLFAATLFVMDALQMTLFANNMWKFPSLVRTGDLDYHLVRPASTLFFVSLRDFAANSFLNLLMAVGILVWALAAHPGGLPAGRVLLYAALLPVSLWVHYCCQVLFLLPVFWLHSGNGLRDLYWSLDTYVARPVGIFTGWARRILVSLLPLAIVVSFPVRALIEPDPLPVVLHMLAVAAGAGLVLGFVWSRALRAYASASS